MFSLSKKDRKYRDLICKEYQITKEGASCAKKRCKYNTYRNVYRYNILKTETISRLSIAMSVISPKHIKDLFVDKKYPNASACSFVNSLYVYREGRTIHESHYLVAKKAIKLLKSKGFKI